MIKFTKTLLLASACTALMLSPAAFAKGGPATSGGGGTATPPAANGGGGGGGGGNGGGGGKATATVAPTPAPQMTLVSTSVTSCVLGVCADGVGSDRTILIQVGVQSDGGDNPAVVQTSGPTLVPTSLLPVGRGADAKGVLFGTQSAFYEWTPSRADIGTDASVSFRFTSASGATLDVPVHIGIVQDVPAGEISGLTATKNGTDLTISWNAPADASKAAYQLCTSAPLDQTFGVPVCIVVPAPGVPTMAQPDGTLTQATVSDVTASGATAYAYARLQAFNPSTGGLQQESAIVLPQ